MLIGLANDHLMVMDHSQEEQALKKIQHEWAEARVKGDSSYARQLQAEVASQVTPVLEK